MSEPQRPQSTSDEPEEMRPIPDGGLQQSMPEWLRRPPAWRALPKKEEPASETAELTAESATEETPAPAPEELPDPDTSEIDPRSLVDITDLPQWLQDLAARGDALSAPTVSTESNENEETDMPEPQRRLEHEPADDRTVAFEPKDKKAWETPEQETKVYGGGKPSGGMNRQIVIALALIALAIILILVVALF